MDRAHCALFLWSALPVDASQEPAGRGVFKFSLMKAQAHVGLGAGWEIPAFWIGQAGKAHLSSQCRLDGFWGHVVSRAKGRVFFLYA